MILVAMCAAWSAALDFFMGNWMLFGCRQSSLDRASIGKDSLSLREEYAPDCVGKNKDSMNRRKHRVSFREASYVVFDRLLVLFSLGETRSKCLPAVAHTEENELIRIITARDATATEDKYREKRRDEAKVS
jgi:uncharacterized DUF497 family protein